jgi:hypothetical protein
MAKLSQPVVWITPQAGRELPVADGHLLRSLVSRCLVSRCLVSRCLVSRCLRRAVDLAWSPADVVLATRNLSNLVVVAATLAVAALCVRDNGLDGLIINLPGLAVVWAAAYGLIRLGRWWRGVYPPEHTPRRLASWDASCAGHGQRPAAHGRVCGVVVAVPGFSARSGARTACFMIVGLRVRVFRHVWSTIMGGPPGCGGRCGGCGC